MPPRRTPSDGLTPCERSHFAALARWLLRGDEPPSVRVAAVLMDVSKSRAHELLLLFEQNGLIARVRKKPESTGVTNKGKRVAAEASNEQPAETEQKK